MRTRACCGGGVHGVCSGVERASDRTNDLEGTSGPVPGGGKPFHGHNSAILADRAWLRRAWIEPGHNNGSLHMSMLSNLDLIRRVPLFSMLTADQAQAIADSVVKRRFRRGETGGRAGPQEQCAVHPAQRPRPRADGRLARPRGHPGGARVGRLRRRDEPHRQRAALGHRARRDPDRHAGAGARRLRALPAREQHAVLRHHARPGAPAAQCRPADRVAGAARRLRPRRAHAAGHGRGRSTA